MERADCGLGVLFAFLFQTECVCGCGWCGGAAVRRAHHSVDVCISLLIIYLLLWRCWSHCCP
jgi:hypothetical protein